MKKIKTVKGKIVAGAIAVSLVGTEHLHLQIQMLVNNSKHGEMLKSLLLNKRLKMLSMDHVRMLKTALLQRRIQIKLQLQKQLMKLE